MFCVTIQMELSLLNQFNLTFLPFHCAPHIKSFINSNHFFHDIYFIVKYNLFGTVLTAYCMFGPLAHKIQHAAKTRSDC